MEKVKKLIWKDESIPRRGRFLQARVIVVVSVVILLLFLAMGIMEVKRSEMNLRGFMENHGLSLIEVLERLTQENLDILIVAHQRREVDTYQPRGDEAFLPHKWLTNALAALGKEVDERWRAHGIDEPYLRRLAEEKNFRLIALIDNRGRTLFQTSDFQGATPDARKASPSGRMRNDLLSRLSADPKINFLALRRKDGKGTVVLALDEVGMRFWSIKVSVEKALEKFGEVRGKGISYIVLRDLDDSLLGSTGVIPVPWKENEIDRGPLLTGEKAVASNVVMYRGQRVLDIGTPLRLGGKIMGTARLGLELEGTDAILQENKRNLFVFLFLAMTLTVLSLWFFYRTQNRHLAGIVEMERRLEKAERLSALGQLAAGVAHEIRNPLNAISMASQRMSREFMPAEEEKKAEFRIFTGIVRDEIRRLNGIIEEFLSFSRSRRLQFRTYPLVEVLQKIVGLFHEEAASRNITIHTDWGAGTFPIPMDMDKLQQALLNFFKNAMESIEGGGRIDLGVALGAKGYVKVSIADTGCGMEPAEVSQIFSPEYTTKEKGLGLGLALAHEIIRGHGGEIRVFSERGVGSRFEVILPTVRVDVEVNEAAPKL